MFAHLLTDVIIVSKRIGTGTDEFGVAEYGPNVEVACAYQQSFQKIRDIKGNERVSAHSVATAVRIDEDDRVWLPATNGATPDPSDPATARIPLSIRNDRSRSSGFRFYMTFF